MIRALSFIVVGVLLCCLAALLVHLTRRRHRDLLRRGHDVAGWVTKIDPVGAGALPGHTTRPSMNVTYTWHGEDFHITLWPSGDMASALKCGDTVALRVDLQAPHRVWVEGASDSWQITRQAVANVCLLLGALSIVTGIVSMSG